MGSSLHFKLLVMGLSQTPGSCSGSALAPSIPQITALSPVDKGKPREQKGQQPFSISPAAVAVLMTADVGRKDAIKYNIGYWPSLPADAHKIHLTMDFPAPGVITWKETLG